MPVVSHDERSHVVPHFDHLDLRSSVVPLMTLSALHDAYTDASGITWEVMLHLISIVLTKGIQGCNWWCNWCHMVPMPIASHDQRIHGTPQFSCLGLGIQWCQGWCHLHHMMLILIHMVLHEPKCHVAPLFNYLDIRTRSTVVVLTMLLASHDASVIGVTWPKKSHCISFQWSWNDYERGRERDRQTEGQSFLRPTQRQIILLRRLSWKGSSLVTLGNNLGDRTHQVDVKVLLTRWSWKSHSSVTYRKTLLCTFIVQVPREG